MNRVADTNDEHEWHQGRGDLILRPPCPAHQPDGPQDRDPNGGESGKWRACGPEQNPQRDEDDRDRYDAELFGLLVQLAATNDEVDGISNERKPEAFSLERRK